LLSLRVASLQPLCLSPAHLRCFFSVLRPPPRSTLLPYTTLFRSMTFATVRPNNIPALERDESRTGEVQSKEVDITDLRTVIKDVIRKSSDGVDMSEASVVIAGGRGVKSEEGFNSLYELADL